jgi:hypothetical protein
MEYRRYLYRVDPVGRTGSNGEVTEQELSALRSVSRSSPLPIKAPGRSLASGACKTL